MPGVRSMTFQMYRMPIGRISFDDVYDFDEMVASQRGLRVMGMEEFLASEGVSGRLRMRRTTLRGRRGGGGGGGRAVGGALYPPRNDSGALRGLRWIVA